MNISSQTGDIWQKPKTTFLTIFGSFQPSINNCGNERKFFFWINKDHFQSLKKAESSFEVGFWISVLKREIFKKTKFLFFINFWCFYWSCDFCFQSLSVIKLSITDILKKTIIDEKIKTKPLVKSDLNRDLSERRYSQKTERNQVPPLRAPFKHKKHHRGSTRINPVVQNCFSTSNTT